LGTIGAGSQGLLERLSLDVEFDAEDDPLAARVVDAVEHPAQSLYEVVGSRGVALAKSDESPPPSQALQASFAALPEAAPQRRPPLSTLLRKGS
jgi:hypothetical protein